jgi:hypothetical protein
MIDKVRRRSAAPFHVIVLAALMAGCAAGGESTISVAPSIATPPATATPAPPATGPMVPTAGPTIPPELPLTVVEERDGIRVTVTLERNPLPAGEPTWADLGATNVGTDAVSWLHDACATPAGLGGEMVAKWRPGAAQQGNAKVFKDLALRQRALENGLIQISFTPEPFIGRGSYACADIGITESIAPGERRQVRAQWNGMAHASLGPPPTGLVTLRAWAGYYWRTIDGDPPEGGVSPIEFEMPAWISGGKDGALLDPPEVVDAALVDAAFVDWLGRRTIGNGNEPLLWFDPELDQWHVELITYCDGCEGGGTIRGVLVDPASGEIVGDVDHPWDGSFLHHGW